MDYFDGEDGYTPVKGKDYWTAEDQEAIDTAKEGEERRAAAEDARAQAEEDRAAAEQSRVAEEEQRQAKWQTLKGDVEQRISDAVTAAQNANKAETAASDASEKADAAAQRAEDAISGMEDRITASERALLDKVCPPFEESGRIVQCHPVEGTPLSVQTRIDAVQHFDWVHRIAETAQVTTTGKNLLDPSTEEVHGYNIWAKNPFTEAGVYTIQAFASGSYTWCCYVSDANGDSVQYLRSYITGDHPTTMTIEEQALSAPYILIGPSKNPGSYSLSGWQMMVEKGDTASTAYEPYTGGKASPSPEVPQALVDSVPTGKYYVPSSKPEGGFWKIELDEALGSVPKYADAIEVDRYTGKYRVIQRTGQIVLDGSDDERWTIGGKFLEDQSDWYYTMPIADSANVSDGRVMCSHYPYGVVANNGTAQGASVLWSNLRIRWGSEQPVDAFRAQLAASPITVRYQLQTESVIIGQAERVKSVSGLTALNAADMALTQPDPDHPCAITGWDSAEMVRCGRNLLDLSMAVSVGAYGFTTELQEDGLVRIFGTYTGTSATASFTFMDVGMAEYNKLCSLGVKFKAIGDTEHIRTVRYTGNNTTRLAIDMGGLTQGNAYDVTFGVMAYIGDGPSKFEPYCGESWAATLHDTVYGGSYDWTAGELVVTHAFIVIAPSAGYQANTYSNNNHEGQLKNGRYTYRVALPYEYKAQHLGMHNTLTRRAQITSGNGENTGWNMAAVQNLYYCVPISLFGGTQTDTEKELLEKQNKWLEERYAAGQPMTFCYEILTPYTINLTPEQILAIPGVNTLYSNTGDTIVAGRMSPIYLTQSILDRLAALEGAVVAE